MENNESTCETCDLKGDQGWGPLPEGAVSHCRDCHRSWRLKSEGHCAGCHQHFSSEKAFDLHRMGAYTPVGERYCAAPASVTYSTGTRKLFARETAYGMVWSTNAPLED